MIHLKRIALMVAAVAAVLTAGCGASHTPAVHPATAAASPVAVAPSAEVIAARLGLRHITAYTAATDPNHLLGRQNGYTSKVNWGPQRNGSIEVFRTVALTRARKAYLGNFAPPLGDGYDCLAGTALLRLSAAYTPAQTRRLEAAFRAAS
jgi:hypothetical protein